MRRLLLHMGLGKTGSSALQVGFVKNRAVLAEYGIHYPTSPADRAAEQDRVTTGNAGRLSRFLVPRLHRGDASPRELLRPTIQTLRTTDSDTVLYSSEFLNQFEPERMGRLVRRADALGWQVHGVVYLRDVAGHAMSYYSQTVKRAGQTRDLADYLREGYHPAFRDRVSRLLDVLPREQVTLIHYDSVKHELTRHFSRAVLGVDPGDRLDPVERSINRSLTQDELALLRQVNKVHGGDRKLSGRVGDLVIDRPPLGEGRPTITEDELALLDERFAHDVEWLNRLELEGGELSVAARDVPVVSCRPEQPLTDRERFLAELLGTLVATDAD